MSIRDRVHALPPFVVDVALAVVVLAGQLAPFVSTAPPTGGWPPAIFLVMAGVSLPVAWRRKAPFLVLVVTELAAAAYALFPHGPRQPLWYGALIAMFTVAAQAPRWQRVTAIVGITWGAFVLTGSLETAARGALLWTTAYVLGRAWASRQEHVRVLLERALYLERERELEAERERSRIALDMHDILAHAVSVMVAQAEAGPVAMRHGPERTEAVFDTIAEAGRDAMGQLRRILGVLDGGGPACTDIPGLVERVHASGRTAVTLTVTGTPVPLSAEADSAAYRIVQEALTNVIRHAHADTATVTLAWRDGALFITVRDNGTGPGPAPAQTPTGGHGLNGIRARATACGGSAECAPAPDGGFEVTARLPGVQQTVEVTR
jgi:signal transduction histidine kinase